jgi:hypothetical protein
MAILRRKPLLLGGGSRKKERPLGKVRRARIRNAILVVLGVLVGVWAVQYSRIRGQRQQALMEVLRLQEAVRAFRWDYERCPHDLEELSYPPAGGRAYYSKELRDPWDRPYRMVCPGRLFEGSADVSSPGPDGEMYTNDDVKPH